MPPVHHAAVLNDLNLWPGGVIPYALSADFSKTIFEIQI